MALLINHGGNVARKYRPTFRLACRYKQRGVVQHPIYACNLYHRVLVCALIRRFTIAPSVRN